MKRISLILSSLAVVGILAVAGMTLLPSAQAGKANVETVAVAEQTVTFAIEKMTCAACPITVRKAMQRVDGVRAVSIDFDTKIATVTFDPEATTPDEIGRASTDIGYPASIIVSEAG